MTEDLNKRISEETAKELLELAKSESFRKDMKTIASKWRTPFIKDGEVDFDAYIEFVQQFNEFINHEPKPFKPMMEKEMKL
ncbi:MAG: hypothetical protein HY809_04830 [Nitrospirae bacterium]|nr:hypothetical protein [Nitrospirota bacterium]